jgi:hypothetical protein
VLAVSLALIFPPANTHAAPSVRLSATLAPERLGHSTTIGFGFDITEPEGRVPPALTELDVRYPGFGIATSGLGLSVCSPARLEATGPAGCPPDSRMGYGRVLAEIQFGPEIVKETADVSILRGPAQHGHLALLFYADGRTPVDAQIVFPGRVFNAHAPFGGAIHIDVPLVPSLPGAPDVAVVRVRSAIGPQHLTYFEEVNGRTVAYHPQGIMLPNVCPHGGFQFAADFGFQDGSHASAEAAVPCPPQRRRHHAAGKHQ